MKHSIIRIIPLIALFLLVIGFCVRYFLIINIAPLVGEPITLTGYISDEPKQLQNTISFHVDGVYISGSTTEELTIGDMVLVTGERRASGNILQATIEKTNGYEIAGWFRSNLTRLRKHLKQIPPLYLPGREAALINGMVLGEKTADHYFQRALQKTGTIHILVVSGANLTMVAGFLIGMKRYIGKRFLLVLVLLVIWVYALLTGANPPVLRAAIMVSMATFSGLLGRQYWQLYSLTLAGLVMLLLNPLLINDLSFQLSFAATLGLLLFTGAIAAILNRLGGFIGLSISRLPFGIGENLATTLAAQLVVDPLIVLHFRELSLVAPLVNVLVLPVVLYLTCAGIGLLILGSLLPILAEAISLIILIPSTYFVIITTWFAKLPFAAVPIRGVEWYMVIAYYLFLCVVYWLYVPKQQRSSTNSIA